MRLISRRFVAIGLGLIGLSSAGLVTAQETSRSDPVRKDQEAAQRVEGVIVKVRPFAIVAEQASRLEPEDKKQETRYELTINTVIPWVDYVRDEAVNPDKAGGVGETSAVKDKPKIEPKIKDSVATEGQPKDTVTETHVNLTAGTKIELRYRSSNDESNDGAPTVEAAEALDRDPADKTPAKGKSNSANVKPLTLQAKDLRVGQYVIVEYTKSPAQKPATKIIILKPIGGSNTSAKDDEQEKPESKKKP